MRAVRYYGKEDIRIDTIPDPTPGPNEVLLAPAFCGICGTDLHEYINGPHEYPSSPHILTGECTPLTLGHEFSGVVLGVGSSVTSLQPGDRAVLHGVLSCGQCEPCRSGNEHVCIRAANVGQHGRGGGLAERFVGPESMFFRIPDHIGLDVAALCEPLSVCEHAINQLLSPPEPGESALVLGCGAIGLGIIQLLRARGVEAIFASDISETRRRAALAFGALQAFDPKDVDVVDEVRRLTDFAGAHMVFECAGIPAAMRTALIAVRIRGAIIGVALQPPQYQIDTNQMVHKEITFRGSLSHRREDYESVICMLEERRLKPDNMITKIVSLEKVVEEGILGLARADEGLIKILVQVNDEKTLEKLLEERSDLGTKQGSAFSN